MTTPPNMSEKPSEIRIPEPASDAAKDSLFSPVIVIAISIVSNLLSQFVRAKQICGISLGVLIIDLSLLVILIFATQGLIRGIKALIAIKISSKNKVFWIALTGSCMNGLILLWVIYVATTAVFGFR